MGGGGRARLPPTPHFSSSAKSLETTPRHSRSPGNALGGGAGRRAGAVEAQWSRAAPARSSPEGGGGLVCEQVCGAEAPAACGTTASAGRRGRGDAPRRRRRLGRWAGVRRRQSSGSWSRCRSSAGVARGRRRRTALPLTFFSSITGTNARRRDPGSAGRRCRGDQAGVRRELESEAAGAARGVAGGGFARRERVAGGRGAAAMAPRSSSSAPSARPGLGLAAAAALGCAAGARAAGGRRGGRMRAGAPEPPWEARVELCRGCRLLSRLGCGRQPGAHDR